VAWRDTIQLQPTTGREQTGSRGLNNQFGESFVGAFRIPSETGLLIPSGYDN